MRMAHADPFRNYNSARGRLDNKRYADNQGPTYTYTAAGRLQTRTWVRGITTNSYNNAGDLRAVAYSDTTPSVTYGFDRRGRQTSAAQAGATAATRLLDDAGHLLSEAYSGGPLGGLVVTNTFDEYLRRSALSLLNSQSSILASTTYGYDGASRLQTVSDGVNSAAYTYLAYSPLVSQIDFAANSTPVMSTLKQYDFLNRLTNISTVNSAQEMLDSHAYVYNSANQRTAVTNADNSYWLYQYDALGQVISGRKYWPDDTPVAGQQFQYSFDDIGNRKTAAFGGDEDGGNLESASYNANNLNQYVQRSVPGYVSSLGTANSNATVSLWAADGSYGLGSRKGEYFRAELPVNNSTGAVWLTLTNLAVLNDGSNPDIVTSTIGHEFLPQTPETLTHDADGNLTQDGRWTYTWDAENRLVQLTPSTAVGPQISLKFEYDWKGRRIRKRVWPNAGWNGAPTNDASFAYDNWNLQAELNFTNKAVIRSYVWGLDLSGTLQAAGGVGGLLFIGNLPSGIGYCASAYDGNGNVAALVSMSAGTNCATYEYGPFGEAIRATGPMAHANPFRFSTKYQDHDIDVLYYGYRYYSPASGRWISRDPAAERDSLSLYCAVANQPCSFVDGDGRAVLNNSLGIEPELPPVDVRPCKWGGWKRRNQTWDGQMESEPFDGYELKDQLSYVDCRGPGVDCKNGPAIVPDCTVTIYFRPGVDPKKKTYTTTLWEHEAKHAADFASNFKSQLYAVNLGRSWCFPKECHEIRKDYVNTLAGIYETVRIYQSYSWEAKDYPDEEGRALNRKLARDLLPIYSQESVDLINLQHKLAACVAKHKMREIAKWPKTPAL